MKYKNLLVNTSFKNYEKSWVANNSTLKRQGNSLLVQSTSRLFGVAQDFLLFKQSRLYFGIKVKANKPIGKVSVGIRCNDELHIVEYKLKLTNKWQTLSVIADIQADQYLSNTYSVYVIAEAMNNTSAIMVKEPMLFDLSATSNYYSLKSTIDNVPYVDGIEYKKENNKCVFSGLSFAGKYWGVDKKSVDEILWDGKNGLTFTVSREASIYQQLPLLNEQTYLIKVLFSRVNGKGECRLTINNKAYKFDEVKKGQLIVKFEAKANNLIKLTFTNTDEVVPMVYYIQDILMVNLTQQKLIKLSDEELKLLPYMTR